MKNGFSILLITALVITGFTFEDDSKGPVIVELFTAEGCSSCPAADELLAEMSGILNKEGKNVVGLSFHVTYWNKLGWVDPYSKEAFTDRQRKYSSTLRSQQLYTPQAVVNGESEFVGSNPLAFRDLVTQASEKSYTYALHAVAVSKENALYVQYDLGKAPKQTVMNIAVVEKFVEHFVAKGENKDRTLKHTNVVRTFEAVTPEEKGEIAIKLPDDFVPDKFEIVIYTQNTRTFKITGATLVR